MNFYQIISEKQIDDDILIFCEVVNQFQATTTDQAKDSKLSLQLTKSTFDSSFVSEDAEPAFKNACENKNREKAKKRRNKKKSKNDKESAKDADFSAEQEHITKRIMSSFRNHLDDSRSRSQIFKK